MSTEELEPLPPDLQRLLRRGRPGQEPPAGAREAVLSFVTGAAVTAAGAAAGATSAAASRALAGRAGGIWGAVKGSFGIGGLVLGAVAGAVGHAAMVRPHDASPAVVTAPSPVPVAARPSADWTPVPTPAPEVEAPRPAASSAAGRSEEARADHGKDTSLGEERALIDMARTAVARGQGDAAIVALGRHAREFPRGRLAEEREWLWIQALVQTGATDQARERASRFRAAFPQSLMLPAVDQVLAPARSPDPPSNSAAP